VSVFNLAGLPAAVEPDMPLWLHCHVPLCVAFESVSVGGMKRGGGASWREALTLARGKHSKFKLIQGLGYSLYPRAKQRIAASPAAAIAAMLWFVSRIRSFRELLATGKAECCGLIDDIVGTTCKNTRRCFGHPGDAAFIIQVHVLAAVSAGGS
jgi:2-dehydropantoate 2-reductase